MNFTAERNLTTRFGADTSGFKQGVSEVVEQLDKYNKALVDNQYEIKKVNKEISELEKKQKELKKQMTDGGTDKEKQQYAELTEQIEQHRITLAQLRTDQTQIRNAISETTAKLKSEGEEAEDTGEGFTILKGAISDLAADALQNAVDKFKELATSGEQALNSLQAQTGMTTVEISELKEQMYDLYGENYGESLEDVANVLAAVKENINETDPEKIKEIAKNAIAMSDTFGSDVEETLQGVNALMEHMGLTAEEAFDYIAKGSQNGLDKTGELSDNLAEYAQIWAQAGFNAEEMFSVLQNGVDSGAYNLDKVNDLVKEILINIIDGRLEDNIDSFSDKTAQIFEEFKNGKATQKDVFDSIINDLNTTSGLAEKLALASENWSALGEDNAMSVIEALNNVNDSYSNVEGTMQSINDIKYDDIESQISALGRQLEVDIIQPLVEDATPHIKEFISWVSEHLPEVTGVVAALTTATLGYKAAVNMTTILSTIKNSFVGLTAAKVADTAATDVATVATNGLNTAMKANPILLVVSAVASLVIGLATYSSATQSATDDTDGLTKSVERAKAAIEDYDNVMDSAKDTYSEMIAEAESEASLIEYLGEQYDELRQKTSLSSSEQEQLNMVVSQLAEHLNITTDEITNQSGAYKDLSDRIKEVTSSLREQAELEATTDLYTQAIKARKQAETEAAIAFDSSQDYYEKHKDIIDGYSNGTLNSGYMTEPEEFTEYNKLLDTAIELSDKIQEAKDIEKKYKEQVTKVTEEIAKQSSESDNLAESTSSSSSAIEDNTGAIQELIYTEEELEQITENAVDAFDTMVSTQNTLQSVVDEVAENQTLSLNTLNNLVKKYPELIDVVNDYINGIKTEQDVINELTEVYENDVDNYNDAILAKAKTDTELYNQFVQNSADIVNEYKEKYGIDLENYTNVEAAKLAVKKEAEAQKRAELAKTALQEINAELTNPSNYGNMSSALIANIPGSGNTNMRVDANSSEIEREFAQKMSQINVEAEIEAAGKQAAKEFEKKIKNSSYYADFYGGSYTAKDVIANINSAGSEKTAEELRQEQLDLAYAAYEKLVNNRIELIEKETEAAEKAADKQIAAIDKQIEARKRLNEDEDRQAELDAINAQLAYAQLDDLSRRELERKRQDLLDEQAEVDWERQMEDKKESIQNGLSATQSKNDEAIEALQAAAESAKNYFDQLAGTQSNAQIVTNNSDTRNIQIIQNALNDQQMVDKMLAAIYSK